MMVINNNIPALTTYGIVNNTSNALQKSIQKLSTGLRINSAADDAAGLSISEKMRAQINGLDRAVANAQDGVSLIQTAEGALTETHSILQRMRELSVQAANDTFTAQDRSYIQEEVDLLRDEIDHIGNTTTFNTKKLLNGDAAVLWSSSDLSTKAIVNGGLRNIDQFGQKKSVEGNYKITVKATPGDAEIQKTDIFKVKHEGVGYSRIGKTALTEADPTITDGIDDNKVDSITTDNLTTGIEYTVKAVGENADIGLTNVAYKVADSTANTLFTGTSFLTKATAGATAPVEKTYDLAFEVLGVSETGTHETGTTTVKLAVTGFQTSMDGTLKEINSEVTLTTTSGGDDAAASNQNITGIESDATQLLLTGSAFTRAAMRSMAVGDKVVVNSSNGAGGSSTGSQITVAYNSDPSKTTPDQTHTVNLADSVLKAGETANIGFMYLDKDTGELSKQKMSIKLSSNFGTGDFDTAGTIAKVMNYEIGDVAKSNVKLRDLDKFWDSQGNFMLEDPQTITITQGDGKTAKVTLYGHDTLQDVADKLNDAIANDLGQKKYVDDDGTDDFVNYVNTGKANTDESVAGTFVIRSAVAGKDGTLRFSSKSEDLINALSLNTLHNASESTYTVKIEDAHSGKLIVDETTITGNTLVGKLHENVDVEFDAMTGITATWNDSSKKFEYDATSAKTTTLHLADNTTVFQIGANKGDDMGINIGDMRSHALGLDKVLVTDHDSASRSIGVIDNAIDKVSTQRAKLGAYQNRLEHTMTNLQTSSENLTAAESRIRDTDMAKEMMNFTKLQIMLQAGNSMLAQANQLPQNVLSLIR